MSALDLLLALRCAARRLRPRPLDEAGFTLSELMVGSFIALMVLSTVFAAMRVQGRGAAMQAGLADAQTTTRGAGELFIEDMRMAGFGMLGVDPSANLPPLAVTQSGATTTFTLRGAFSGVSTTLLAAAAHGATTITVALPATGAFQVGQLVLIDSGLSSEVKTITSIGASGGGQSLGLNTSLANDYPIGPNVTQLEVVTYTYDGAILRRNNQVVADNVTQVQVQYVDQNGNIAATPGTNVRSIQVSFIVRQATKLPDNPWAESRITTEANLRNLAFRFTLS